MSITIILENHTLMFTHDYLNREDNKSYINSSKKIFFCLESPNYSRTNIFKKIQPLSDIERVIHGEMMDEYNGRASNTFKKYSLINAVNKPIYLIDNFFGSIECRNEKFIRNELLQPLIFSSTYFRDRTMGLEIFTIAQKNPDAHIIVILGAKHFAVLYHLLYINNQTNKTTNLPVNILNLFPEYKLSLDQVEQFDPIVLPAQTISIEEYGNQVDKLPSLSVLEKPTFIPLDSLSIETFSTRYKEFWKVVMKKRHEKLREVIKQAEQSPQDTPIFFDPTLGDHIGLTEPLSIKSEAQVVKLSTPSSNPLAQKPSVETILLPSSSIQIRHKPPSLVPLGAIIIAVLAIGFVYILNCID